MKESTVLAFISFLLSSLSFMLTHARAVLNTIGAFLLEQKAAENIIDRFKMLLVFIDTCLFLLPAIALALALLLFVKKSKLLGILTGLVSLFSAFYFIYSLL